ncbi:unnamed protein product, partial [Adineta steineri]
MLDEELCFLQRIVTESTPSIKIELPAKDLLAEPIRARGPGGQHVNKSESGCRLTHLPTGIIIERQDDS